MLMAALLAVLLGLAPAHAEKRVALVIGNGAYARAAKLLNPANDARAMVALFKSAGFDVVESRNDLDLAGMRRVLRDFSAQVRDADVAVVYFAGHGVEMNGTNYLVPIDAVLERDIDVEDETVSLDRVGELIEPARQLHLIILDACRDNPFTPGMKRMLARREIGRGLARVDDSALPADTMVAFAAKAGSTSSDGTGPNSPYTAALLKHLATPGLDVRLALGRVRDEVLATTSGRQEPFVYGSLGGSERMLVPAPSRPGGAAIAGPPPEAERAWAAVKDTTSIAVLNDFIRHYGDAPVYGALARDKLDGLKKAQLAVVKPPDVPPRPADPCGGGVVSASLSSRCAAPLTSAQERSLKPKNVFKECEQCPEMIVVPAGRFTLGSPKGEPGRYDNEGPQHDVAISKPFAVGKFHVTVDQFATFAAETNYDTGSKCRTFEGGRNQERDGRSWRNPGFPQEGTHPAVCLSWYDAKAYVDRLAKKTGKGYRLLSEAEWEYAARARTEPGTYPRFWFGSDENDLCRYGNGADQKARDSIEGAKGLPIAPCDDGYAYTSPVGQFAANGFGLHDMFGNAWQWTEDCYHDSYEGAPPAGSAWTTGDCSRRVFRGGSWIGGPTILRVAFRSRNTLDFRSSVIGLRVARTLN
jgi:formylglycine-generating enzyme required for sulfatase activity